MPAAVVSVPSAPRALIDACRFDITGQVGNDTVGYDNTKYPASPEIRCYLAFIKGGVVVNKSYQFVCASDGSHSVPTFIFPSAGAWTVELRRVSNDAVLATRAVTAS